MEIRVKRTDLIDQQHRNRMKVIADYQDVWLQHSDNLKNEGKQIENGLVNGECITEKMKPGDVLCCSDLQSIQF